MLRLICFFIIILNLSCGSSNDINPYLKSGFGYVDVEGGEIWYGILGEGDEPPYLYLHGGPGGKSKGGTYLNAISDNRPIILMDQLGSGLSTYHEDTTLLKVEKFVGQVKALIDELNLNEFYLTGHSWGTALALEYYLKHPEGVKGIVFNSPFFSTSIWVADCDTLITQLPDTIQQHITIAEKTKAFETRSYQNAMRAFYQNFMIRSTDINWDSIPGYELFNNSFSNSLFILYLSLYAIVTIAAKEGILAPDCLSSSSITLARIFVTFCVSSPDIFSAATSSTLL